MFENNPYKLPEDKFSYIKTILIKKGIKIQLSECDYNPFLKMNHIQEYRDAIVKGTDIEPLSISHVAFRHYKLVLRRSDMVRAICFSIDIELTSNDNLYFIDSVSEKDLYFLVSHFWILYRDGGWKHLLDGERYIWAEKSGYLKFISADFINDRFEYDESNLMSLIDIFGEDIVAEIMDYFLVCPDCGEHKNV